MAAQVIAAVAKNDPSTMSGDRRAMEDYLQMVGSIMEGVGGMRRAGTKYLPQWEKESDQSYERRRRLARMTNVFADIVDTQSLKPFDEKWSIERESTKELIEFAEDVDGRGSAVHEFAHGLFRQAMVDGFTWIMVDYTTGIPRGATLAQERELGARPIWVHYHAADVLAVYSARIKGIEQIVEIRFAETTVERDGFAEKERERVRVLRRPMMEDGEYGPPEWELWRKKETQQSAAADKVIGAEWELETGPHPLDIDVIPCVPVIFGQRKAPGWQIDAPLKNAAHLQIELYQQENGLKHIRTQTAYPMLAANGMSKDDNTEIVVGPSSILWGGGGPDGKGEWAYVEPAGGSLTFLQNDISVTVQQLRELGRQLLTQPAPNLTVVSAASATQKANIAIHAWVLMLKHTLQGAFGMTAKWLDLKDWKVEIMAHTEFDIGYSESDVSHLIKMAMPDGDAEPLISREAFLVEMKRRGVLHDGYDPEKDLEKLDRPMDGP